MADLKITDPDKAVYDATFRIRVLDAQEARRAAVAQAEAKFMQEISNAIFEWKSSTNAR